MNKVYICKMVKYMMKDGHYSMSDCHNLAVFSKPEDAISRIHKTVNDRFGHMTTEREYLDLNTNEMKNGKFEIEKIDDYHINVIYPTTKNKLIYYIEEMILDFYV